MGRDRVRGIPHTADHGPVTTTLTTTPNIGTPLSINNIADRDSLNSVSVERFEVRHEIHILTGNPQLPAD
jgi:phosphoribosylcarboxyaminoimidazole (NCAIR) mutase